MKKLEKKSMQSICGGGYWWKCNTTGWKSSYHSTFESAFAYSEAHKEKYDGHKTTIYVGKP